MINFKNKKRIFLLLGLVSIWVGYYIAGGQSFFGYNNIIFGLGFWLIFAAANLVMYFFSDDEDSTGFWNDKAEKIAPYCLVLMLIDLSLMKILSMAWQFSAIFDKLINYTVLSLFDGVVFFVTLTLCVLELASFKNALIRNFLTASVWLVLTFGAVVFFWSNPAGADPQLYEFYGCPSSVQELNFCFECGQGAGWWEGEPGQKCCHDYLEQCCKAAGGYWGDTVGGKYCVRPQKITCEMNQACVLDFFSFMINGNQLKIADIKKQTDY